jgi:uncharacterized protein YjbI with pentapeptide repeats
MESLLDAPPVIPQVVWIVGVVILLFLLLGYTKGARFIGFGPHVVRRTTTFEYEAADAVPVKRTESEEKQTGRTIWDWMTVVTISAVLAFVAISYTGHQAQQQQYIQEQQAKNAALLAYLDAMSALMFDRNLLTSNANDAVRDVARARTLVGLLSVGPENVRYVIRFLYESGAIKPKIPEDRIIDLTEANLTDADLQIMPLNGIDLGGANLSDGLDENKRGAILKQADLQSAYLQDADLKHADLRDADLQGADLKHADLEGANLQDADLKHADLEGATMPNGQKYEDWLKSGDHADDGKHSGPS